MTLSDELQGTKRKFWIQRADFSSEEFDPVELKIAQAIVTGYNWASELALFHKLFEESENHWDECCSPGIGFLTDDEKHLLHICPMDDESALCFYLQLDVTGQSEDERWSLENAGLEQINQLLKLFFEENYLSLMAFLEEG